MAKVSREKLMNTGSTALYRQQTMTVAYVDDRGVWLEVGDRLAHLPLREASGAMPGEQLEVFLYQDAAGVLQATCRLPLAQAGEFAGLTVRSVGPHGALLDWGMPRDLLVPLSLQPERMQAGRTYVVKVDIDPQGRPFANARIDDCLDRTRPDLQEGVAVDLLIWQITDLGAKVIVNQRFPALLYRDDLPTGSCIGRRCVGYVKRLRADGKLDVTLRKVGAEGVSDAREVILKTLEAHGGSLPLHDQSSPAAIQQILGMSKKTFKKAVGGLYKDGLVTLINQSVALVGTGEPRPEADR
jgi:predicted RNA-binding protein (virulence factor B family)